MAWITTTATELGFTPGWDPVDGPIRAQACPRCGDFHLIRNTEAFYSTIECGDPSCPWHVRIKRSRAGELRLHTTTDDDREHAKRMYHVAVSPGFKGVKRRTSWRHEPAVGKPAGSEVEEESASTEEVEAACATAESEPGLRGSANAGTAGALAVACLSTETAPAPLGTASVQPALEVSTPVWLHIAPAVDLAVIKVGKYQCFFDPTGRFVNQLPCVED